MKRKSMSLLLALFMAMSLVACGVGGTSETTKEAAEPKASETAETATAEPAPRRRGGRRIRRCSLYCRNMSACAARGT